MSPRLDNALTLGVFSACPQIQSAGGIMANKSAPPVDKETDALLDDQIRVFKAGIWKAVLDDLEPKFRKKGKRPVPFDDPNSCGFEVFDDGKSVFKIVFRFMKYWSNEQYDHWHLRWRSIQTWDPGNGKIDGYEKRYLKNEIPALSVRAIVDFIENIHPVMMLLKD
jgi:hypothetical protein